MKTVIEFDVYCYDRFMYIEVNEEDKERAEKIMDSAYDTWIHEADKVGDACVEEYIWECLEEARIEFKVL